MTVGDALEVLGAALLVTAAALWAVPLAFAIAGIALVYFAQGFDADDGGDRHDSGKPAPPK